MKKNSLIVALIIFVLISVVACGYIVYDKILVKEDSHEKNEENTVQDNNMSDNSVTNKEVGQNTTLVTIKDILERNNPNIKVQLDNDVLKCSYQYENMVYDFSFLYENNYLIYVNNTTTQDKNYRDALWYTITEITYATGELLNIEKTSVQQFLTAANLEYAEEFGFIYKTDGNSQISKFSISLQNFHVL